MLIPNEVSIDLLTMLYLIWMEDLRILIDEATMEVDTRLKKRRRIKHFVPLHL